MSGEPARPEDTIGQWEPAILAQPSGLAFDAKTVAEVVAVLQAPEPAVMPDFHRIRIERQRRDPATNVAVGRITPHQFLARIARLPEPQPSRPTAVDAATVVTYLRLCADTFAKAGREAQAAMVASVYDEIIVRGEEIVTVRLTPDAYANGLALALPERVKVWNWRARRDSNPRPCGPKPHALVH